jgi:hypothetical protein
MVRAVRFELTTNGLKVRCATAAPCSHILAGDAGLEPTHVGIKIRCLTNLANPLQLQNPEFLKNEHEVYLMHELK